MPGTDLEGRFPTFLVLVLEERFSSRTRKRLHLLLNTSPWKGDRNDLIIPPSVPLRLELSVDNESEGERNYQRRDLQVYTPGTGPFRGLGLMESELAVAPIAFEIMKRAHELASAYPRLLDLSIRAVG